MTDAPVVYAKGDDVTSSVSLRNPSIIVISDPDLRNSRSGSGEPISDRLIPEPKFEIATPGSSSLNTYDQSHNPLFHRSIPPIRQYVRRRIRYLQHRLPQELRVPRRCLRRGLRLRGGF